MKSKAVKVFHISPRWYEALAARRSSAQSARPYSWLMRMVVAELSPTSIMKAKLDTVMAIWLPAITVVLIQPIMMEVSAKAAPSMSICRAMGAPMRSSDCWCFQLKCRARKCRR